MTSSAIEETLSFCMVMAWRFSTLSVGGVGGCQVTAYRGKSLAGAFVLAALVEFLRIRDGDRRPRCISLNGEGGGHGRGAGRGLNSPRPETGADYYAR